LSGVGEPKSRAGWRQALFGRLPGRLSVLSLGAFLALQGCSLAPTYKVPAIAIPANYKEQGMWMLASPQDAAPRGDWWRVFQDPVLDRLEGRIEDSNPTLAQALAIYDAAQADAAAAASATSPFVTLGASDTANQQSQARPLRGNSEPNQYCAATIAMSLNYEVDFWGRVRNEVAAGKAEAQASSADLATAKLSLQTQLARDYVSLRGFDAQAQLLAETTAAFQRALDLTETRRAGGIASGLDVDRASTQLSDAKTAAEEVTAARALLEHAIATLIGEPASVFTLPAQVPLVFIPETPVGLPATLLQRRPDIAAAERRVFAANAQIGVERAAFFPTITLGATGGFQDTNQIDLLSLPYSIWSVGPALVLPLFEGGLRHARVARARAEFAAAAAQYRGTVLAAFQQVEDGLSQLSDLSLAAEDAEAALKTARAAQALATASYEEGAINYLNVIVAQTTALSTAIDVIGLQTRRQTADVALISALGGGWQTSQLPGPSAKMNPSAS
jgi:outer membrane protein, multidrug efflux system